jgi:hypothetical protein
MQQQQTSLRCDDDPDFVGNLETAASLEAFLGKKHLNVSKQFRAVAFREPVKKYNVSLNQRQPLFRERRSSQASSPVLFQYWKDHPATVTVRFERRTSRG